MRTRQVVLGCVCLLAVAAVLVVTPVDGLGTVQEGEDNPQAEAGLDQTVRQGAVVVLDAGGSVAPDGEIVAYNWTIRRPDNSTAAPDCRDCQQMQFQPTQVGTHAVTVTVTDDENRTATDTMYVEVLAHEPPQPSISAPDRVQSNGTVTVEFTVESGDEPLSSVARYQDGTLQYGEFVDGPYTETVTIDYPEPGTRKFELVAADEVGHAQTAVETMDVEAVPPYFAVDMVNVTAVSGNLRVEASVENIGGLNDTQSIRLCREECENEVIDEMANASLAPGEATTVVGNWSDWDDENGEVFVAVESENDSATERRILAEPSHLSIQGLPAKMEDGERTDVRVVLHYEGGITETVTSDALITVEQTEDHSTVEIVQQDEYDPLTVEAVASEPDPKEQGNGIIHADYEGRAASASTTIQPLCEYEPDADPCLDGWGHSGSGNAEWGWSFGENIVPDEIEIGEEIYPEETIIWIWDYVGVSDPDIEGITGGVPYNPADARSSMEADPDKDWTEPAKNKISLTRTRSPDEGDTLWLWEAETLPYQDNVREVTQSLRVEENMDLNRGNPGYVRIVEDIGNKGINYVEGASEGEAMVCLQLNTYALTSRDGYSGDQPIRAHTPCASVEVIKENNNIDPNP